MCLSCLFFSSQLSPCCLLLLLLSSLSPFNQIQLFYCHICQHRNCSDIKMMHAFMQNAYEPDTLVPTCVCVFSLSLSSLRLHVRQNGSQTLSSNSSALLLCLLRLGSSCLASRSHQKWLARWHGTDLRIPFHESPEIHPPCMIIQYLMFLIQA